MSTSRPLVPPINFCQVSDSVYRSAAIATINFPFIQTLNLRTIVYLSNSPPHASLSALVNQSNNSSPKPFGNQVDVQSNKQCVSQSIQLFHFCDDSFQANNQLNDLDSLPQASRLHQASSSSSLLSLPGMLSSPPSPHSNDIPLNQTNNMPKELAAPATFYNDSTVQNILRLIIDPVNQPVLVCCHYGFDRTGLIMGCLRKLQRWNYTSIYSEYRRFATTWQGSPTLPERNDAEQFIEFFDCDRVLDLSCSPNENIVDPYAKSQPLPINSQPNQNDIEDARSSTTAFGV